MPKVKICSVCEKEVPKLWRSNPATCKSCDQRINAKPINKKSEHRIEDDKVYKTLNRVFLDNHKVCEAELPGCSHWSTEVHHLYSGKDRDKYYLVISTWKAVCPKCHYKIHNILSMEEAIEKGLKLIE